MAGRRRGCVNSLWTGNERGRIAERLKATLAGVLELEALRRKQLEVVDAALEQRVCAVEVVDAVEPTRVEGGSVALDAEHGAATSRRQQAPPPSCTVVLPCRSGPEDCGAPPEEGAIHASGRGSNPRWSALSWDAPSDLLTSPTPDPSGTVQPDSDSRPSSGFYSVSGSSLSDSSYSVSSDATQGGSAPPARPSKLWEQVPLCADHNDILWSEGAVLQQQPALQRNQEVVEPPEGAPVSVQSDPDSTGLSFLSDRKLRLSDSLISSLLLLLDPTSSSSTYSLGQNPQLEPRYCTDLMSRRTKEVYPYPSPLHAVALQSPLFTLQTQEQSATLNPEGAQQDETQEDSAEHILPFQPSQPSAMASFTQLEQYISRLARQYHSRVTSSSASDFTLGATTGPIAQRGLCMATNRGLCTPGKSHGSTQSLSAFESRNTLSMTPCKSLMGNAARVGVSSTGKKVTRNSINLGNLPSATGEDLNISLNLNLNLNPGLHSSHELLENPQNASCGALRSESAAAISTASATSLSSATSTPALRTRPRISTCPSNLSHRSSLEVTSGSGSSPGFGSSTFSRSLDWSSCAPPETGQSAVVTFLGSAPGSQRSKLIEETKSSPKLSEDSPMVGEISRLSGLSRSVVVGLMEQGVELDIDCFSKDEVRSHSKSHLTPQTDRSHDYTKLTESNPQRPIHLSLEVTHSPRSPSSLTPPHSRPSSPFQTIHIPSPHYSSHCHYQQIYSPSNLPSSTASSPAYHPASRGRSPPRPLQPSSVGDAPLSVFRRDAPFQCSMPCSNARNSPLDHGGIPPRGGSLRMSQGGSGGWKRAEGEGLYRGKHASHKLIRAATVSSYANKEDYSWDEEHDQSAARTQKKINKLWRGFEEHLWSKESEREMGKVQYGHSWRGNNIGSRKEHRRLKASSSGNDKRPNVDSPMFSVKMGKEEGERRSSSLRLSRRALFRSESQGLLVPHNHSREPAKRTHWVSSLDVGQGGVHISKEEGVRLLGAKKEDKQLSSTASLFNLSCSQSLEGSCHSLSPLSSSSFSPSPPPRMPLQRSLSLRDLGRRVFGSMRSLSLKRKPSKK
ncbi:uncharacterized protein si:ch211-168f7.5 [Brachionichthys hirsutus]|uniref:uncharacterized protein si:ch211-168f7.5 n=1 Tax=Brachionichthys hirsutus TaxID=412623 RepID=UPI003604EBF3